MPSLVLLIWLALCALQDIYQRRIANLLTFGAAALALLYLFSTGTTWLGASAEDGGCALLLALLFTLPGYATARLGAGDVKLFAALALATDSRYLLGTFIGAGIASALWVLFAPRLYKLVSQRHRRRLQLLAPQPSEKLPFAPFVLIGFICSLLWIH